MDANVGQVSKTNSKNKKISTNLDQNENLMIKISINYNLEKHQEKKSSIKKKYIYSQKFSKTKDQARN